MNWDFIWFLIFAIISCVMISWYLSALFVRLYS